MASGGIIGGFSWFQVAIAGAQAYNQYQGAKQQAYEYEAEKERTKLTARDKEIERRDRLLKALAARSVQAGASPTTLEGTPLALINADMKRAARDDQTAAAETAARIGSLDAAARNTRRMGKINAQTGFATSVASMFGG